VKLMRLVLVLALSLDASGLRADTISRAGDVGSIALPLGAAVGALVVKDHQGLGQLALAYASAMAVVYVLKPTINRTRPDGGSQSFPSGHAASAFVGASFLQRRYGWRLGIPAYALAAFVGYSRVHADRHYPSDVYAGAAIGIGANLVFTHRREHVSVNLAPGRDHAAFLVTIAW
jgi:membrane-associated phospholipid phosphatase